MQSLFAMFLLFLGGNTPIGRTVDATIVYDESLFPIGINVEAVRSEKSDGTTIVLVTLSNLSTTNVITGTEIQVAAGLTFSSVQKVDVLLQQQSKVTRFDVPTSEDPPYVVISYWWNNQPQSLARSVELPTMETDTSLWSSMTPAIISLVGVAIGSFLVHWFSGLRERRRSEFEWSKMLFEKYEKAYRDFLFAWAGVPIASILKIQFDVLCANSLVPSALISAFHETQEVLLDGRSSQVQKAEACRRLQSDFDRFISTPWFHVLGKRSKRIR